MPPPFNDAVVFDLSSSFVEPLTVRLGASIEILMDPLSTMAPSAPNDKVALPLPEDNSMRSRARVMLCLFAVVISMKLPSSSNRSSWPCGVRMERFVLGSVGALFDGRRALLHRHPM